MVVNDTQCGYNVLLCTTRFIQYCSTFIPGSKFWSCAQLSIDDWILFCAGILFCSSGNKDSLWELWYETVGIWHRNKKATQATMVDGSRASMTLLVSAGELPLMQQSLQ